MERRYKRIINENQFPVETKNHQFRNQLNLAKGSYNPAFCFPETAFCRPAGASRKVQKQEVKAYPLPPLTFRCMLSLNQEIVYSHHDYQPVINLFNPLKTITMLG